MSLCYHRRSSQRLLPVPKFEKNYNRNGQIYLMALMESQIKLKKGDAAPDFELLGVDGQQHAKADYEGKGGFLVVFMCNHCPYVKAKIEALNEIYRTFGHQIGMVGINSNDSTKYPDDSYANMKIMSQEKGLGFDYLVDDTQQVAKRYGAICTPDPFLFDSEGRLVFHGRIDDGHGPDGKVTTKTMLHNIDTMLNGDLIQKDFEPSVGCSIKWKN